MALELVHWFIIGFLLILPILYELSSTFRYHAKFTLYYACILGIASVVCVYGWIRPGDVNNHWFIIWAMNHVKNLFGIEVEVRGKENLESDKPYIMVMNHQSSLDCIGMFAIWPSRGCALIKKDLQWAGPFGLAASLCGTVWIDRLNHEKALNTMKNTAKIVTDRNHNLVPFYPDFQGTQLTCISHWQTLYSRSSCTSVLPDLDLHFLLIGMTQIFPSRGCCLVKKELMWAGSVGLAAYLCGTVFIDRLNREKALDTMKKTAGIILKRNVKLMVFPEGTRNHEGSLMPFKKGAFHLAVQAQIPIVPVVFSSYAEFYNKKDNKFTTGKFIITCLPKIPTRGLTANDVTDLTENVRKQMLDTFNQTSFEATQNKLASKITNGTK